MKLKDYIVELQNILDLYPDIDVVYSSDDEGNSFGSVNNIPTLGNYEGDWRGEFIPQDQFEECDMPEAEVNAVCIN